jgi:hypothetical protein
MQREIVGTSSSVKRQSGSLEKQRKGADSGQKKRPGQIFVHDFEINGKKDQQAKPEGQTEGTERFMDNLKPEQNHLTTHSAREHHGPQMAHGSLVGCSRRDGQDQKHGHEENADDFQINAQKRSRNIGTAGVAGLIVNHQAHPDNRQNDVQPSYHLILVHGKSSVKQKSGSYLQ